MSHSYSSLLENIKKKISVELDYSQKIMNHLLLSCPKGLNQYLRFILNRKGKRMRSIFTSLLVRSFKKVPLERTSYLCTSIELLHLATLIHDDIIDQSTLRRNEVTAHKKWGVDIAVLLGDYLLSKSIDLVINDPNRAIIKSINHSASLLVAGEILEISSNQSHDITEEQYLEIVYNKTASLWKSCGECAALVAEQDPHTIAVCSRLGENLGMAFQIIDDFLDYGFGNEQFGKKVSMDLSRDVTTYPLILFFKDCTHEDRFSMKQLLKQVNVPGIYSEIISLLNKYDCFEKTRQKAMFYVDKSLEDLKTINQNEYVSCLIELFNIMKIRKS